MTERNWDGTPIDGGSTAHWARRHLRIHKNSASKTLRREAVERCRYCHHPIDWYQRYDNDAWIPLLLGEFPAHRLHPRLHWSVFNGVAHSGDDGTTRCRIPHPAVCPALQHDDDLTELEGLRRSYAVTTRGWIDEGVFVPAQRQVSEEEITEQFIEGVGVIRHTVSYASVLLLAPTTVDELRCIARAATTGGRCQRTVFDTGRPEGHWDEVHIPVPSGRAGQATLWDGQRMWIYSLDALYPLEWKRWRSQRCTDHAETSAPSVGKEEWLPFHALRHDDFIVRDRPADLYTRDRGIGLGGSLFQPKVGQYRCASCTNRSYEPQSKDWLCWECAPVAARRARTHAKWQSPGG
ncbi:DUF6083 domain-containing protein [Streptomyces sp. NPDC058486]|uniref:DUF6083 domain-containing protein n=1 Tax=unclassified Streptomyces TaxID=2593676 RepID=UPI003658919C